MHKLFPLPILLLAQLTLFAGTPVHKAFRDASSSAVIIRPLRLYDIGDSIPPPSPKIGWLQKLAQALKFRKNARAKEQERVLDIIASTGLKDSLRQMSLQLNSISDNLQKQLVQEV